MEWYHYLIILAVLVLISLIIIKINKKDFSSDINKLLKYLGGKENIVNAECNMSRFKVIIKDMSKVDKDAIQRLGAKGIVEIDDQIKIILGQNSKQLKKYIDEIR